MRGVFIDPAIAQNVRRGHDRRDAILRGRAAQRNGGVPINRAVVDAGKTMKMQIDQNAYDVRAAAGFASVVDGVSPYAFV